MRRPIPSKPELAQELLTYMRQVISGKVTRITLRAQLFCHWLTGIEMWKQKSVEVIVDFWPRIEGWTRGTDWAGIKGSCSVRQHRLVVKLDSLHAFLSKQLQIVLTWIQLENSEWIDDYHLSYSTIKVTTAFATSETVATLVVTGSNGSGRACYERGFNRQVRAIYRQ